MSQFGELIRRAKDADDALTQAHADTQAALRELRRLRAIESQRDAEARAAHDAVMTAVFPADQPEPGTGVIT